MFHVVTTFPFFLDFGFYVPLLLRVTLGLYTLAIGFSAHHKTTTIIASETAVTETRPELTPFEMGYRGLFIITGLLFIIGFFVQISAIVAIIIMLVSIFDKKIRVAPEVTRVEFTLLIVIALSILVLGAGPFAIDLPL